MDFSMRKESLPCPNLTYKTRRGHNSAYASVLITCAKTANSIPTYAIFQVVTPPIMYSYLSANADLLSQALAKCPFVNDQQYLNICCNLDLSFALINARLLQITQHF